MAKPNAKGRSKNPGGKYAPTHAWLAKMPAYRLLSSNARSLLLELKLLYNGSNNGDIFVSWRDAAKAIGVASPKTAAKALHELIDKGFIKTRKLGSFGNKVGMASCYILTEYAYRNQPPSKDFARYKPTEREKTRLQKLTPSWADNAQRAANRAAIQWPDDSNICIQPEALETVRVGI